MHALAARIGLRRAWFQKPKFLPVNPVTLAAGVAGGVWVRGHYDVTEPKRAAAIRAGALAVANGTEPWRAAETARERWLDFVRSPEGKAMMAAFVASTGHHPARHPS